MYLSFITSNGEPVTVPIDGVIGFTHDQQGIQYMLYFRGDERLKLPLHAFISITDCEVFKNGWTYY